jgi:hypothetical protein
LEKSFDSNSLLKQNFKNLFHCPLPAKNSFWPNSPLAAYFIFPRHLVQPGFPAQTSFSLLSLNFSPKSSDHFSSTPSAAQSASHAHNTTPA